MYPKNLKFNESKLVLGYSGVFDLDNKTIIIFLGDELRTDARRNNLLKKFEPVLSLDYHWSSPDFERNNLFNDLKELLTSYNSRYNVLLSVEDTSLLKDLMNYGFGKKEGLVTGVTYEIDMMSDFKNKQGLFAE